MAKQYYSVFTQYGSQALANALANRTPLQITHMAVGDGNGNPVQPNAQRTSLVRETYRATISAITQDPRNDKQVIFELTVPENVGGFYIREMGIFDNQNRLIAYANCPDSFKPTLQSGSGKVQVLRMILLVSSSDAFTLTVDNSVIFVTRGQLNPKTLNATTTNAVDETGHTHAIAKASLTQAGLVQLDSATDSDAEDKAATPKAVKALKALIDAITRNLGNFIPNSKKSDVVNSISSDTVATSHAVKTAYDKGVEALSMANNKVNRAGDTMTGNLEIKGNKDWNAISLFNKSGKYLMLESVPDSSNSEMGTLIYRNTNGQNINLVRIPRKNGTIVLDTDFSYQKIGNFEIRKYPDGTMLQTYFIEFNDVHAENAGLGGTGQKQLTWAVAFVEKPMVFGNITTSLNDHHDVGVNILTKSTNTTLYWYNYEHSHPNQGLCRLQFFAIGRWK